MKNIDATEQAYKNGYKQGKQDAVEHGRWVWSEENKCWICSNCKRSALNNYRGNSTDSNYCPNCGAKMDGQQEEAKSSGISQRTVQALERMGQKVHGGEE